MQNRHECDDFEHPPIPSDCTGKMTFQKDAASDYLLQRSESKCSGPKQSLYAAHGACGLGIQGEPRQNGPCDVWGRGWDDSSAGLGMAAAERVSPNPLCGAVEDGAAHVWRSGTAAPGVQPSCVTARAPRTSVPAEAA